jgi:exopolyphosphatase/guanosine-5'-triphosphate,3'-diphosphate pyrophosphatase
LTDGGPTLPRPAANAHVAVIDIGSNSVRLVVYDRACRAPIPRFNEKALCALGRGLEPGGTLDPVAAAAAHRAVVRYVRLAEAMAVADLRLAATEAVRRAADGGRFLAEVERSIGRRIEVLSGEAEARLSALGVAGGFWQPDGVMADLGGGSVELAAVDAMGAAGPCVSLPLGTLRLRAAVAEHPDAARATVDRALAAIDWLDGGAVGRDLYVVGGGWRALGRIHLAGSKAPLDVIHGHAIDGGAALGLGRRIAGLSRQKLLALPGVPRRRIDTLPAAGLLLERAVARLRPARVVFSALGLREGLLFAGLQPSEMSRDPLIEGAADLGRQRNRAADIGEAMADWTAPLFAAEGPAEARLRIAACAVSDVGWLEAPGSRARDAFFMLAHYPFVGVDHPGRVAVAATVFTRYEGAPDDRALRPLLALLSGSERARVETLGRAVQLGYRLCGGVPGLLSRTRIESAGNRLLLHLPGPDLVPDPTGLEIRLQALARSLGCRDIGIIMPEDDVFGADFESILVRVQHRDNFS